MIEDLGSRQHGFSTRARHTVRCRCDCGKEITVRVDHLLNSHTQSCGCYNREQVGKSAAGVSRSAVEVGKTYGQTKVLKRLANNQQGAAVYMCQCSCGHIRQVIGARLLSGKAKLCQKMWPCQAP